MNVEYVVPLVYINEVNCVIDAAVINIQYQYIKKIYILLYKDIQTIFAAAWI